MINKININKDACKVPESIVFGSIIESQRSAHPMAIENIIVGRQYSKATQNSNPTLCVRLLHLIWIKVLCP